MVFYFLKTVTHSGHKELQLEQVGDLFIVLTFPNLHRASVELTSY